MSSYNLKENFSNLDAVADGIFENSEATNLFSLKLHMLDRVAINNSSFGLRIYIYGAPFEISICHPRICKIEINGEN